MLETNRLIIRRFIESDWKDLYEYLSDKSVVLYEPYEVFSTAQAKEEAKYRAINDAFYAVCLKENQKVIGNLYLSRGDFNTWELGFVFNRRYQKQGYATESAKALLHYAFTQLGARRIIAMCSNKNERSWKLLERLNFRKEGLLIQNVSFKQDEFGNRIWFDTYLYAMLKSEWNQLISENNYRN